MMFFEKINTRWVYFFIVALSVFVLVPYTGNVHLFDWDEINFAECAREMIVMNSYHTVLLNFQPFWEKPPLFIWMQVLSMQIFGINEWAARFPNLLNGIITLCLLFYIGKKCYSQKFGLLWAMVHLGTILPHLYFRSGIIDPWYNLFGFISLIGFIEIFNGKKMDWIIVGGLSLGLAVLTKGPAMVLIIFFAVFFTLIIQWQKLQISQIKYGFLYFILFLVAGSSWFFYEYISGNGTIISAFIDYQVRLFKTEDSGHGGFFLYHFVVVLLACFPASVLMLRYFSKSVMKDFYSKGMFILMMVVLIIFSIVKTKILHYASMSYYSISFLATYVLMYDNKIVKWQKYVMIFLSALIGLVIVAAGTIEYWKHGLISYLRERDVFAAENLSVKVEWYGLEFVLGILFFLLTLWYVRKKNYSFKTHLVYFFSLVWWIALVINNYVGKVEQYTQNAAIVFFEFCADKQYNTDTYGYKSYAHLFYGKRMPPNEKEKTRIERYLKNYENAGYNKLPSYHLAYLNWLMEDKEKFPVFLVCKIQDEKNLRPDRRVRKLYSKGGYVFFIKQR